MAEGDPTPQTHPCPICGEDFETGRKLGAHKLNVHSGKRGRRPRKNQQTQSQAVNGDPNSGIASDSVGDANGAANANASIGKSADSFLGAAQAQQQAQPQPSPPPSVHDAPRAQNPYINADGTFNDGYVPDYAATRPQPRANPGQPAQQMQQQRQSDISWKDIAVAAVGLGQKFIESRSAARAGPDPFAAIGQAAYQRFLASFSTEVGKATGKGIGQRTVKQGDISPDAIVQDIVSPKLDDILRNTYEENQRLRHRLAELDAAQTGEEQVLDTSEMPPEGQQQEAPPPPQDPPSDADKVMHE